MLISIGMHTVMEICQLVNMAMTLERVLHIKGAD